MQSFELDNNRLIKNLLQLLGANEEALAREIGATKEELHSWKRGTEIPAKFKRKMQHLTRIGEFGKSFMSLMEKMGQDIENGEFPGQYEPDVLSEGEAALAQAINHTLDLELADEPFTLWEVHNHFTVAALYPLFDHHIFSAYVSRPSQDTIALFPDFLIAFIEHSNILADWVCDKNGIDSLDELPCEIAHPVISIIIQLTCSYLVESGFDSDYDGSDWCEHLQQNAEHEIYHLIEMIKMIDGQIDVNYYCLLDPVDDILFEADIAHQDDSFIAPSQHKIQKHLSFETKEILKGQREIMEGLNLSAILHEFDNKDKSTLAALVNATRELDRLKKEFRESGSTTFKVNEKILRACTAMIRSHGFES